MNLSGGICPLCGRANKCALLNPKCGGTCWCADKPPLPKEILKEYKSKPCFCEECYDRLLAKASNSNP